MTAWECTLAPTHLRRHQRRWMTASPSYAEAEASLHSTWWHSPEWSSYIPWQTTTDEDRERNWQDKRSQRTARRRRLKRSLRFQSQVAAYSLPPCWWSRLRRCPDSGERGWRIQRRTWWKHLEWWSTLTCRSERATSSGRAVALFITESRSPS